MTPSETMPNPLVPSYMSVNQEEEDEELGGQIAARQHVRGDPCDERGLRASDGRSQDSTQTAPAAQESWCSGFMPLTLCVGVEARFKVSLFWICGLLSSPLPSPAFSTRDPIFGASCSAPWHCLSVKPPNSLPFFRERMHLLKVLGELANGRSSRLRH